MDDFEKIIFKKLSAYTGKMQSELKNMFSIDSAAKNINDLLLARMLDYEDRNTYISNLRDAGITPKTIRVQKTGHIRESMSFPTFKFTEIIHETWEQSALYRSLAGVRFMFVIFEETTEDEYAFSRVKFWTISDNDLNEVKKVWERTAKIVAEGVKLTWDGRITNNNLPKQGESPVAHVRPHARDGKDTYPLPDGRQMVKQGFWLNRTYIEKIIKEIPEELSADQELMTPDEMAFMKSELTGDFYFLEDVAKLFGSRFRSKDHINPQSLKRLGYISYPDYIIRDTYNSAENYFSAMLLSNPTFDLADWDVRMIQATAAIKVLAILKANYDILEFDDGKYLTYAKIHSVDADINKVTLRQYVDSALIYAGERRFFNTTYLRNQGFDSPLFDYGFSDFFYDSLIINSQKIRFLRIASGMIFYTGYAPMTIRDFIKDSLKEIRSEDIDLYVNKMNESYGISLSVDKLISISKNAEFYYNPTMEKVYYSKQDFYDEL